MKAARAYVTAIIYRALGVEDGYRMGTRGEHSRG